MTQKPDGQILEQTASIDRDSYEPAYAQLANILRRSMAAGILLPGDQLPSEAQLCERYGVSPMTVRRAINTLVEQGVVSAEQGRGTFVKPVAMGEAVFQLKELQDLFSDTERTTVNVLETRIVKADERVAPKTGDCYRAAYDLLSSYPTQRWSACFVSSRISRLRS